MDTRKIQQVLKEQIAAYGLSKEQVLAIVENVFAGLDIQREVVQERLLMVNRELKVVAEMEQAAAVVALIKEQNITDDSSLRGLNLRDYLVNIAFLEPVGRDACLLDSLKIHKEWQKTYYPEYRSSLIAVDFYRMAQRCGLKSFRECWLRSRESDGYPQYRTYPMAATSCAVEWNKKLPNVYASLVMTKDDFMKLNPDVDWDDYRLSF